MRLDEIKQAIDEGKRVFMENRNYEVIRKESGKYYILSHSTGFMIGLTMADGVTMNEEESRFFIGT